MEQRIFAKKKKKFGRLIRRWPYLYKHSLPKTKRTKAINLPKGPNRGLAHQPTKARPNAVLRQSSFLFFPFPVSLQKKGEKIASDPNPAKPNQILPSSTSGAEEQIRRRRDPSPSSIPPGEPAHSFLRGEQKRCACLRWRRISRLR